jgi:tetratricopeptide (TPR) repeat protein
MPASTAPVSQYTRQDAARILGVPERQIATWQRAGLIGGHAQFNIRDLAGMRLAGIADPLHENAPVSHGARLVFRHGGGLLDPLTQQFRFDFDAPERREISLVKREPPREQLLRDQSRAQELFQQAVQLEEKPDTLAEAARLYAEVLEIWPKHAPASINLGTILYNDRRFAEAEQRYRAAAEIDPDYALAFFDLGNVLDEMQRLPEAIAAYARAIQLVPQYADAHYNLALAYERTGERRRALRHWLCYVRLDPVGPWATHARMQARRTLATERLSIVTRGGKLAG